MTQALRIGILGTRGIPNRYGGFEQCAQMLGLGFKEKGHEVWVYNAHAHEYREKNWRGINIIHCYDPEDKLGTAGQFIYDWNCIRDARKRNFDIIIQLGYTSSSVFYKFWPKKIPHLVNMDGLEWKRSKYHPFIQRFLKKAEAWAVKGGDVFIADNVEIQNYLKKKYHIDSTYIAYGAEIFETPDNKFLGKYSLKEYQFDLILARMEPENHIEEIIKGYLGSKNQKELCIVGNIQNKFGQSLIHKYSEEKRIRFLGPIYDTDVVNNLRYFSRYYFHGHSVGGTNPSLLEAMASRCLIVAHENPFNKSILHHDAFYFSTPENLSELIDHLSEKENYEGFLNANIEKIQRDFTWTLITDKYEAVLQAMYSKR